ncbi:hypothetical protein [Bacillus sp. NPDC094106]|uniref:hypothetical protein n=1 Tax=Bacillus sp. NPDC094106 TaxID=3363949 RepID=UPI003809FE2C
MNVFLQYLLCGTFLFGVGGIIKRFHKETAKVFWSISLLAMIIAPILYPVFKSNIEEAEKDTALKNEIIKTFGENITLEEDKEKNIITVEKDGNKYEVKYDKDNKIKQIKDIEKEDNTKKQKIKELLKEI